MLATYQQGLSFFSLIAIFVGAFLIYNTFSMTVVERTASWVCYAIGMSRRQVLGMVLAEAGLLSILGSALGLVAGIFLARSLTALMGEVVTASSETLLSVPWQGLVASLAVGIGVTLGAAVLPAVQAARVSPLQALQVRSRIVQPVLPIVWISGLVLIFIGWLALYRIQWPDEVSFQIGSLSVLLILFGATLTVSLAVAGLERLTRPIATLLYGNEGTLGSQCAPRVGRTTLTVASLMVALTDHRCRVAGLFL
jgi:putative ABC transport system permease protein